jgi:hypothetical protein
MRPPRAPARISGGQDDLLQRAPLWPQLDHVQSGVDEHGVEHRWRLAADDHFVAAPAHQPPVE